MLPNFSIGSLIFGKPKPVTILIAKLLAGAAVGFVAYKMTKGR